MPRQPLIWYARTSYTGGRHLSSWILQQCKSGFFYELYLYACAWISSDSMENCTAILCSSGLLRDTDKTILSFSLRPEYMYKKTGPHAAAYISDAGCLYYGQFRNHYPAWRIYYSVFCLQSDAAAYFCLICSAAAAGVHSGNQLWHTGSLQFLFRSIVRPSGSSLFLRFFWWIMYFCADKKCPLSCRNQDTVIYCWSSVSGSSVVSSVSSFTEAVSGASSWRLLMIVS